MQIFVKKFDGLTCTVGDINPGDTIEILIQKVCKKMGEKK